MRHFRSPALAALVASSLHRARRLFRSSHADRSDAFSRPPSSRTMRSLPSSPPHSIARAASFVPRTPIALTPPSARRARVLCAPCPRRLLAPSRAPPLSFLASRSCRRTKHASPALAALFASFLHRTRRHFRSPRADAPPSPPPPILSRLLHLHLPLQCVSM